MTNMLCIASAVLFFFMTLWFLVSLAIRRNDIADILWGAGFILVVLTSLGAVETVSYRALIMSLLVIIWGARLSTRIYLKNRGKSEDFRYRKWREEWGRYFALRSYFQVFGLQGILMLVVLTPVLYVIGRQDPVNISFLDILGVVIWFAGFLLETVADYQLDSFKSRSYNKGLILQTGLWKYSRHPNYFGEVVMWWGLYCIALSVPGGAFTFVGPLVITFLILKVSGIPLLEEHYRDNPKYQQYSKRTSVFVPLPPRQDKE
jgi:steroid 5-alpha reductase family enzyme